MKASGRTPPPGQGMAIGWLGHGGLQWLSRDAGMHLGGDSKDDGLRIEHVGRSATNHLLGGGHLDCKTDCYTPNLTTISRSPPNHGESRLHHATISPSLRTLSLTHTLTRTTKLTLRFQPACMSCRIGSAQAGVWASDSLRVIHMPSSDGAGELRRGRSALHWRRWLPQSGCSGRWL